MSSIIPLLTLILLIGAVPSGSLTQILYEFLILHMCVAGTTHRAFNHSITTIFGAVKIMKILFTYFLLTFKDAFSFNHSKFDRNTNISQTGFSRVGYMNLEVERFKLLKTAVFLDMTSRILRIHHCKNLNNNNNNNNNNVAILADKNVTQKGSRKEATRPYV
jgi:hypothetical protein